jgi:hypothetical protein
MTLRRDSQIRGCNSESVRSEHPGFLETTDIAITGGNCIKRQLLDERLAGEKENPNDIGPWVEAEDQM